MSLAERFSATWRAKFPAESPPEIACLKTSYVGATGDEGHQASSGKSTEETSGFDLPAVERSLQTSNANIERLYRQLDREQFIATFLWEILHGIDSNPGLRRQYSRHGPRDLNLTFRSACAENNDDRCGGGELDKAIPIQDASSLSFSPSSEYVVLTPSGMIGESSTDDHIVEVKTRENGIESQTKCDDDLRQRGVSSFYSRQRSSSSSVSPGVRTDVANGLRKKSFDDLLQGGKAPLQVQMSDDGERTLSLDSGIYIGMTRSPKVTQSADSSPGVHPPSDSPTLVPKTRAKPIPLPRTMRPKPLSTISGSLDSGETHATTGDGQSVEFSSGNRPVLPLKSKLSFTSGGGVVEFSSAAGVNADDDSSLSTFERRVPTRKIVSERRPTPPSTTVKSTGSSRTLPPKIDFQFETVSALASSTEIPTIELQSQEDSAEMTGDVVAGHFEGRKRSPNRRRRSPARDRQSNYEEAIPFLQRDTIEADDIPSEEDEEPLYFNLMMLKQQTLSRVQTLYHKNSPVATDGKVADGGAHRYQKKFGQPVIPDKMALPSSSNTALYSVDSGKYICFVYFWNHPLLTI